MIKNYDAQNWYWIVAGSTTQVYSSAVSHYVPVADPTYVAWRADIASGEGLPARVATEGELGTILGKARAPVPVPPGILDGYKDVLVESIDRGTFVTLFNHENRIRALNSQPPLNVGQFKVRIKTHL